MNVLGIVLGPVLFAVAAAILEVLSDDATLIVADSASTGPGDSPVR